MKPFKKTILNFVLIALILIFAACGVKTEKVDVNEVKAFADTISEKMLTAMNEGNYSKFCEDFDQKMKEAVTEDKFKQIASALGRYESKEIIRADRVQGYTRAFYKTKFSNPSKEYTLTFVFSDEGESPKISGFFYK